MKVALYARVSSDRQAEEKTIDAQLYELRQHCQKNNLIIFDEYIDEAFSGEVLSRPGLDKLCYDAEERKFDAVLLTERSRLSRDKFVSAVIGHELKEKNIRIITPSSPAAEDMTDEEEIKDGLGDLFSQWERKRIAERTKRGRLKKVKEEGIILGNIPPYGYDYVPRDPEKKIEGYYKINLQEADVVRKIFDSLVYKKISIRGIARELTALNIKPRQGIHWRTSSLHRILRNETYIGITHYNKHVAVAPKKKIEGKYYKRNKTSLLWREKKDWIEIKLPDNLKILDSGIFNQAQEVLLRKRQTPHTSKYFYLLKGLLFCASCGAPFQGLPSHGNRYYRCGDRSRKFPLKKVCRSGTIKAEKLEDFVWQTLYEALHDPEIIVEQVDKYRGNLSKEMLLLEPRISNLDKQLIHTKELDNRLLDAYTEGAISLQELKSQRIKFDEKLKLLAKEKESLNARIANLAQTTEIKKNIKSFCAQIVGKIDKLTDEGKREVCAALIKKITYNSETGEVIVSARIKARDQGVLTNSRNDRALCLEVNGVEFELAGAV